MAFPLFQQENPPAHSSALAAVTLKVPQTEAGGMPVFSQPFSKAFFKTKLKKIKQKPHKQTKTTKQNKTKKKKNPNPKKTKKIKTNTKSLIYTSPLNFTQ